MREPDLRLSVRASVRAETHALQGRQTATAQAGRALAGSSAGPHNVHPEVADDGAALVVREPAQFEAQIGGEFCTVKEALARKRSYWFCPFNGHWFHEPPKWH